MNKSSVTNAEVARRIGLTPAGVSRLRTENSDARRCPSYAIMKKIQDEYNWDINEQNELAHFGSPGAYARVFEMKIEADAMKKPEPTPVDPADPEYDHFKNANR